MRKFVFVLLLCSSACSPAFAQLWSGVLDPSRAVDWSGAGVVGGIPSATYALCTTAACNTVAGGSVSAATINAAVSSASPNSYIPLPAGSYSLSSCILIQPPVHDVALRGAGANSTFLTWTANTCSYGGTFNIAIVSNDTNGRNAPTNTATWSGTSSGGAGTYTKGDTSITLSVLTGSHVPTVGDVEYLDQLDDPSDPTGLYIGCELPDGSPACYSGAAPGGYSRSASFSVTQVDPNTPSSGKATYTGSFSLCGSNACAGYPFAFSGLITANNVTASVISSTTTTLVISNGSAASQTGAGGTAKGLYRGQMQMVTVTSVSGTGPYTVGISPGIYAPNWRTSQQPQAWWSSNSVHNIGLESFSITPSTNSFGAVWWRNANNLWFKGMRVAGANTATPNNTWMGIGIEGCAHCEVRDSYFYANLNTTTAPDFFGTDSYVVGANGASDLLVENTIMQAPGSTLFYSADCEGCVAAYNFGPNARFAGSNTWNNGNNDHHAVVLFSLAEGNIGVGLYADSFHGTGAFNTQLRNRWDGREQNCNATGAGSGSPVPAGCWIMDTHSVALILNPGRRYYNAIANVFGTPGYSTHYLVTPSSGTATENTSNINEGYYSEGSTNDSAVALTTMLWGNWDVATNNVRWNSAEVPSSGLPNGNLYANAVPTSLCTASIPCPASFVHSSKPAWWPSGKAWPPIGPEVTGGNVGQCSGGTYRSSEATSLSQCSGSGGAFAVVAGGRVTSIPAMDCYLNVMNGSPNGDETTALAFDPTACYSTTTPAAVTPVSILGIL